MLLAKTLIMSKHIIKNFQELANTKLRRDALSVLEAGLNAIHTKTVVKEAVKLVGQKLTIRGQSWDLKKFRRIYLFGIGKAAADAATELERILGKRITDGIVIDVKAAPLKRVKSVAGTHPLPSVINTRAAGEIVGMLKQAESDDLIIFVISGGGSALLCLPYELKCGELALITRTLMKKGANISEMNTVRKHLSEIQGGQFARLAYPASIVGLIFSDVLGDDLGMIASGPTVMDLTTVSDAKAILDKYDVLRACRLPGCKLIETPKDPMFFQKVTNLLLLNNAAAIESMRAEAVKRGYAARVYSWTLEGEAREVGRLLAGLAKPGEMVLAGGETTVKVRGNGVGGRNQEVALGALRFVAPDGLVLSSSSDGIDNSPAAGAIADGGVAAAARRKKLKIEKYLDANDSFNFFKLAGGRITTGITGSNVSDLFIAARG